MDQRRQSAAADQKLKHDEARRPELAEQANGERMCTSQVCIQPLNQRVRCLSQGRKWAGASS